MNSTHENINNSIISLHGRDTMKDIWHLERSWLKIDRGTTTLKFLKRYRTTSIFPNFALIKHHLNNGNTDTFTCAGLQLIGREIKCLIKQLDFLSNECFYLDDKIAHTLQHDLWMEVRSNLQETLNVTKTKHIMKYEQLRSKQKPIIIDDNKNNIKHWQPIRLRPAR